ncbi:SDR family oxidoreductase [Flavobacterium procerum]|uniref:SDR family oxidoreductase n=1 Tax=Flavobacterium procerum TaxID=1455569 RepID=A0ABV6BUP0_9FLAO
MKTIFITGASAGLGKATARLFQANGWRVIATMRNPEKETDLNGLENVKLIQLDVTQKEHIDTAISELTANESIDVVFNNAGYGLSGSLEASPIEAIEDQINTNLTGVIKVVKAFTPYFKERGRGMFITTTSVFGIISCPLASVYNATKWALEGLSESLSYELAPFNITIKTVAPGGIKSSFVNGVKAFAHPEYDPIQEKLIDLFFNNNTLLDFSEPEVIADAVFEAATDGKNQLRYMAGADAVKIAGQLTEMGSENFRKHVGRLLDIEFPGN